MTPSLNTLTSLLLAIVLDVFGTLLAIMPAGLNLEEEFGLAWLFNLRGEISAPSAMVIVSVDRQSLQALSLTQPEDNKRVYYQALLEQLNRQQPHIIAFSYFFKKTREAKSDTDLANVMAQSGNIILSSSITKSATQAISAGSSLHYETLENPIPLFLNAALAVAPFPLPKSGLIKHCWLYKDSMGGVPTLPTTIFQWYVLKTSYPEIVKLLTPTSLAFKTILPATFAQFKADSHSLENLQTAILTGDKSLSEFKELLANTRYSTQQKHLLSAWLAFIFNDDKFIYLNHYGKPGTLTTIPLSQALTLTSLNPDTFTNKIVMIGQSETVDAEATQGFYNVFSDAGGDISHVEIAATAVANLITDTWLKPLTLPQQGILLLGWASLLAVLCRLLAYRPAAIALVSCSLAYLAISYYLFITAAIWLPVIIPTLLQAPLMLLGISWSRYLQTKQARKKIEQAFHYYLPKHVVKQIGNKPNEKDMKQFGELVSGVCLASDAGEYTRLSEGQHPKALNALLNRYYGVLFPEVIKQQGIISDVIGDAMMALWVQPKPGENLRVLALEAALNIKTAVDHFNALQTDQILTRIGLHYGEMRLGNVGTEDHYEYRAIGDTINTASRIEGLNKQLGTQILVSSKVIDGLSGFACREMGIFFLPGKSLPVEVFELVGRSAAIQPHTLQLIIGFNKALALFQKHQQPEALQQFLQLQKQFPSDGPIRFYIDFIKSEAKTTQVFDAIAAISVKKS